MMKKPKLVILRGKPTSGKSTAWHNLKKKRQLENWLFVDHSNLKENLGKDLGKMSLFSVLKTVMPYQKNIIIEEMSKKTLLKNINYSIKKYNYQIITFQFEVSRIEAYKRDIQRSKDKWHAFMGKKLIDHFHDYHDERFDENAYLVDCNKLGKRAVVDFIIKKLKLK
jgi:tRNA uridine 5-carbamoylmethylation protein Kti12